MDNSKNNLSNNLRDWLDSISIQYKGYEIKNAIIAYKYIQLDQLMGMHNINHFKLRRFLSSIKWKIKLNLLTNKMPKHNMILKGNRDSTYNLSNKNLYVINFSPNDTRCFLHIGPLAEKDDSSLVITVRKDVYDYFYKMDKPVILLNIYNPWRNKKDLEIQIPKVQPRKNLLFLLDIFSLISLSRAASLIDLLDILINENGIPKTVITLQDFCEFDSIFAIYYTGKVPTITLQHGSAGISKSNSDDLWKYLISDWMIVFGTRQAEMLEFLGVNSKKIKILGSVKYDWYFKKMNDQQKNKNKRILIGIGIQQTIAQEKYNKQIYNFLKILLNSKEKYTILIKFHPSLVKKYRRKFIQTLKKMNSNYGVVVEISNIIDPVENILNSEIILTSISTLALEAALLGKPVIEYLSSKRDDDKKYGDYRDFVLHAPTGKDAEVMIIKLLNDSNFYSKVVEKQGNFINSEIMPPPAISRILNFIYNLAI